jgi:hypothetical protein
VNAKSESKVTVILELTEEHVNTPGGFLTAKLFISCASKPNLPPWVYYLRAKVDPNLPVGGGKKK